jgi:DNA-binding transcriptional LysR family regulator
MHVTLDQARALDALARHGTLAKAAASLGKQHSALVYSLKQLELQTDLTLLDRSGYRIRFTSAGERVLGECRKMLHAEENLERTCRAIKTGWEPRVRVVFDGIFPVTAILSAIKAMSMSGVPTQVEVFADFLDGVERAFVAHDADLMISVLAPKESLERRRLEPLVAHLVAQRDHPLAKKRRVTERDLAEVPLLTVRGSDPRLALPTARLERAATMRLNDFHTKREAILAGLGYGWLPEYLDSPKLSRVRFSGGSRHVFEPHVFWRGERDLGRAARLMSERLTAP